MFSSATQLRATPGHEHFSRQCFWLKRISETYTAQSMELPIDFGLDALNSNTVSGGWVITQAQRPHST